MKGMTFAKSVYVSQLACERSHCIKHRGRKANHCLCHSRDGHDVEHFVMWQERCLKAAYKA